jgi:hypothetical protein
VTQYRKYSTDVAPSLDGHVFKRLDNLVERSRIFPNEPIDRKIYRILCDPDLLEFAYNNIKSKPGTMTPGISPETLDGMAKDTLTQIARSLEDESFQFKPGRRI